MALIKCPECKKEVSSYAKICPNCGFPISGENNETKLWFDLSTIPSDKFPINLTVGERQYHFNYGDIVHPPYYNVITVTSIATSFKIEIESESDTAKCGPADDEGYPAHGSVTVKAGGQLYFRVRFNEERVSSTSKCSSDYGDYYETVGGWNRSFSFVKLY